MLTVVSRQALIVVINSEPVLNFVFFDVKQDLTASILMRPAFWHSPAAFPGCPNHFVG